MKKLVEIPPAEKNDFPSTDGEESKKDRLIERLDDDGYKPISVDRAVVIITQAEVGDSFPEGWCQDPLRIVVYPDPDATGMEYPQELFIHCGRFGFMGAFLRFNWDEERSNTTRLTAIRKPVVSQQIWNGSNGAVKELLSLFDEYLTGDYTASGGDGAIRKHDPTLESLGQNARQAVQAYLDYLQSLPDEWKW